MIFKILICIVSIIVIYGLLILLLAIDTNTDNADYLIVLGHKLINNKPDETFKYRLRKAVKYADSNQNTIFVLSGGKTEGNTVSEAEVMKEYLLKNGVTNKLILEDKSTDTIENIKNCLNYIDSNQKVVLLSSNYHIHRSKMICKMLGLKVRAIATYTPIVDLIKHLAIEEVFLFIHYRRLKKHDY